MSSRIILRVGAPSTHDIFGLSAQIAALEQRIAELEADKTSAVEPVPVETEPHISEIVLQEIEEQVVADTVPDFVRDLRRENEAYGDTKDRLAKEIADLENKRFLQIMTDDDHRHYERLKKAMNWFETRQAVELV